MPSLIIRHRLLLLATLIAAVAAVLPFVPRAVVPDNALTAWFLEDDPALVEYRTFHEQFGNDEVVLLGYRNPEGLLNPTDLGRLRRLTAELEAISGVSRVLSLANAQDVDPESGLFEPVLPAADSKRRPEGLSSREGDMPDEAGNDVAEPLGTASTAQLKPGLRERIMGSPFLAGRLVNADASMTLVWITMDVMDDIDERRDAVIAAITETADGVLGPGEARLGGMGVIYAGLNEITRHDFGLFMGLSYLLMFTLMFVLFRRLSFVLLALAVVAAATLLMLGVMGIAGSRLNLVTVMLPTIVTIFGIADVIHVMNRGSALSAAGLRGPALSRETLGQVFRPCLYTTLTTGAAFLSFGFAEMRVLREFGFFTAVGIAAAFVATMVLAAVVLPAVRPRAGSTLAEASGPAAHETAASPAAPLRPQGAHPSRHTGLGRLLGALIGSLWRRPLRYAALLAVATGLALLGARHLVVDTYTLGYLPDDHRVVQDHEFLEAYWGPYATLEMTVRPLDGRDMRTPEVLRSMGAFEGEAAELPAISRTFSLHTVLERLSEVRYGDDRLLRSRLVLDNMLVELDEEALETVVTDDYALARITLTGEMASAGELGEYLDQIGAIADRHFFGQAEVRFAGYPPLYVNIIEYVMRAQIRSFWIALLLIFLLILVFVRDLKLALIAMVPNLFPVVLIFGIMGTVGITLDVATATVAAIVLGVAIDDTIHMLYHFRAARGVTGTREAVERTLETAGRAVVFTSIVLALGFMVLLMASVKTVFYFGLLTALAMAAALVGDLILLPLLLKLSYPDREPCYE